MENFKLLKTSKNEKLSVYDYAEKINRKEATKMINKFRREMKKNDPEAKMTISFKVKHKDANQNEGYFWNSIPLSSVQHEIQMPKQYGTGGRIQEISIIVVK